MIKHVLFLFMSKSYTDTIYIVRKYKRLLRHLFLSLKGVKTVGYFKLCLVILLNNCSNGVKGFFLIIFIRDHDSNGQIQLQMRFPTFNPSCMNED